jgi:tetratricopeptide (TPR) repeat protein
MTTEPSSGSAPAMIAAIEAALRAGEPERASALAERALAAGVAHPLPLRLAAAGRLAAGRFGEAEALLRRAMTGGPTDPSLRLELATCFAAARRPEAALEAADAALRLSPGFAPAWEAKARLLMDSGDWPGSRQAFERAAALTPQAPEPLSGLASLALQAGDLAEARRRAEQALARRPDHPEAAFTLAKAELEAGAFAAAEKRLARLAADQRAPPLAASEVRLALGEALHGLKRWREAFQAFAAGKAILRSLYAERAASRPGETAKARALVNALHALPTEAWAGPPDAAPVEGEAEVHVFLVGFPRSGTTLLEQALAGHPRVSALEERPTLAEPIDAFLGAQAGLERLLRLGADDAAAWRRRYWAGVRGEGVETAGRVFVDKAPGETANLLLMGRLFPRARFLFALRDPRDVVLSSFRHGFQMNAMTYEFTTLETAAGCYNAVMGAAFAARERLPLNLVEVRHEALVADFEAGLREVCAFLDLDWRREMADVAATARARRVRTPSAPQVREGVNRRGVGGWRAYEAEMTPVLPILQPWIERLGYG